MLLPLEGELNIYTASTWKDRLMGTWQGVDAVIDLDLSAVNEFDSAGLQVLLLAQREARKHDKRLRLLAPSRCVMEVMGLCQLSSEFDIVNESAETAQEQP